MFTGIITDIGEITEIIKQPNGISAIISTNYDTSTLKLGCSVAHNGVCLTVTKINSTSYEVDISDETLSCTNLTKWKIGQRINLERALCVGDELGGHIVSGHIDDVGEVVDIQELDGNKRIVIQAPIALAKYIATKGSITVNGVSLTVNSVDEISVGDFSLNIIPHTLQNTTLDKLQINTDVNLEIDLMARYAARLSQNIA